MRLNRIIINNSFVSRGAIAVIVALIFARDIFGISVNKYCFVALAGFAMLLVEKYEMCELLAFLIPLFAGLPGNYIACIALLLLFIKSKGLLTLDKLGFWCSVTILIIELIAEIMTGIKGFGFSIIEYIKFTGAFLLTFIFIFDADSRYNYWNIVRNFVFGLLVVLVIIIGEMLNHYSLTGLLSLGVRIGDISEVTGRAVDEMTLTYNSNALGMFCSAGSMVCLIAVTKFGRKWLIPFVLVYVLAGIMTQSRAFVITILLGVVLFIVTGNEKWSTVIKRLLILLICLVIGSLIIQKYIPSYFDSLVGRFKDTDVSNGRIDITSQYWERFVKNTNAMEILFGVGLQDYRYKYGMTMAAHFGFEEVLITWGIIGSICVITILFHMVQKLKYKRVYDYDMLIPFFVFIVGLQSGQFFTDTKAFMSLLVWISFAKIKSGDQDILERNA